MRRLKFRSRLILFLFLVIFFIVITRYDNLGFFLIIVLLGIAGGICLYSLLGQLRDVFFAPSPRVRTREFSLKLTATLMAFFLVLGTALYFYVFHKISQSDIVTYDIRDIVVGEHVKFNNTEYLLRSLLCSLDLFVLDVDSNILDRLDDKPMIKVWISIQAVLSFSCTVILVVGLIYSRLSAYFKLAYRTKIDNTHNHLYLFFGNNTPTESLIKDIIKKDPNAVIILIDEANIKENDTNELDGIFGLVTHKQKTFEIANKYSIRVAVAGKSLSEIDKEVTSGNNFDAFEYLGLSRIAMLIERLKKVDDAQLHVFFLDENEERNIQDIITFAKDKTIMSIVSSNIKHKIYCHARYNGPNRVVKDVATKKKLNIKIIDSSHIAIERLKLLPEYHPFNVVEIDKNNPATVKGSFDALIVGFGEVGRDAFRFLYEFGAFVNNNATTSKAVRSQFNCTIVDKDIEKIEGTFKAGMPGIFNDVNDSGIEFKAIDYNHKDFYDEILRKDKIANLNYVIISIGNNDEAISLAARIFSRFRQYGGDLSKLIILVRCTDNSKVEALQKIADHYNFGYGDGEKNKPVVRIFGNPEEIYTFDLVISNKLVELGKKFHESYRLIKGEGESWDERHASCTQTSVPNIDKLRKLRRQESQDMANALHMHTKMAFLKDALAKPLDWTSFLVRYFKIDYFPNRQGSKSNITYPELTEQENLIILRLAMLEHLRWNAAHELLGYVRRDDGKTGCDEKTMRHNCLKNWDELDEESRRSEETDYPSDYKAYDFVVVDTTIALSDLNTANKNE